MPCILNASNEAAVQAFLEGKINFLQMPDVVENAMKVTSFYSKITLDLIDETDREARAKAKEYIIKIISKK